MIESSLDGTLASLVMPVLDQSPLEKKLKIGESHFPELKASRPRRAPPWIADWLRSAGDGLGAALGTLCATIAAAPPDAPFAAAAGAGPSAAPAPAARIGGLSPPPPRRRNRSPTTSPGYPSLGHMASLDAAKINAKIRSSLSAPALPQMPPAIADLAGRPHAREELQPPAAPSADALSSGGAHLLDQVRMQSVNEACNQLMKHALPRPTFSTRCACAPVHSQLPTRARAFHPVHRTPRAPDPTRR